MSPVCLFGAVGDALNFVNLAALTAYFLIHSSLEETSSRILASVTLPLLSTLIMTVTSPLPKHLYDGVLGFVR